MCGDDRPASDRVALLPRALLVEAWHRRRRAPWPDDFDGAMSDPLYSRLVVIEALHNEATRVEQYVSDRDTLPPAPRAEIPAEGVRYWWHDRD